MILFRLFSQSWSTRLLSRSQTTLKLGRLVTISRPRRS